MRTFITVCVSGYFDPLHIGHCEYLKNAKALGDKLIVILNNDSQRRFIKTPQHERKIILESIRYVDEVIISYDYDDSVGKTLKHIKPDIFAKGLIPSKIEEDICKEMKIKIITNVGQQIHLQDILTEFR